jgi:hypothetical protein
MNRNHRKGLSRILSADVSRLFLHWLQRLWSSLRSLSRQLLHPDRGRRNRRVRSENFHACPLAGVDQFRYPESMALEDLMATVAWRNSKQIQKRIAAANLAGYEGISSNNFHLCPLVGIKAFRDRESLTVSNLMERVMWRIPQQTDKTFSAIALDRQAIDWD